MTGLAATPSVPLGPERFWVVAAAVVGLVVGAVAVGMAWQIPVALGCWLVLVFFSVRDIRVALLGLLLTLPLDIYGRIISEPVSITAFHVVLGAALVAWGVHIVADSRRWYRPSAVDAFGGMLVIAALWSLPSSGSVGLTVVALVRVVFLWAFASMYVNTVRTTETVKHIYIGLIATAIALGTIGIAQQFVPGFSFGSVVELSTGVLRAAALFDDPNNYAGFLASVLAAAAALVVHGVGTRRGRIMTLLASGVIGLAVVLTYSRSAWLSVAFGVVFVVLTAPPRKRSVLLAILTVAVVAAVLFAPASVLDRAATIVDPDADRSTWTRAAMFVSTFEMIEDDWVFGRGFAAYHLAYPPYRKPGTLLGVTKSHQIPFTLWAEAGVMGLMSVVVFIVGLLMSIRRPRPDGWDPWESASLAGLMVLLVGSLFQNHLYFEYLWLFFALLVISTRLARRRQAEGLMSPEVGIG